jgi:hypothetical protein
MWQGIFAWQRLKWRTNAVLRVSMINAQFRG